MSVSDPLIKEIKGLLLRLHNDGQNTEIHDSNKNLQQFCQVLEKIFFKGFIEGETRTFYGWKILDLYHLLGRLAQEEDSSGSNFVFSGFFVDLKNDKNVRTSLGKFRLLIRTCLVRKCISSPLELMIDNFAVTRWHYTKNSILGDEILSAILLSVLLQCNKINFQLDLFNSSFLDVTWEIPAIKKIQLVPCKELGLGVSFSENRGVIVNLQPNGVSAETGEISVGDVLDNLNGTPIDSSSKGRLQSIVRARKGLPIDVIILKAENPETGAPFPPIQKLWKNLRFDLEKIKNKLRPVEDSVKKSGNSGYRAVFLGSVDVGSTGHVWKIREAMRSLLQVGGKHNKDKIQVPVHLEVGEISLKITDLKTDQVVFTHSYMQISSCGSTPEMGNYFGYIAGDENCDTATEFVCYVFRALNEDEAGIILQSLGQGFYRTHFAV